ncbi:MAG: methylated-DNA--[protein]-cysteine S-methyltransferase [Muribaculaceae bacterium]|nr:methylated-DNA--[protein]-cysteine S-methyltransferase [Muribaculaceae bacterium]MDE6322177.1 methylated-DNA--[protein]-cysteine S-methyltransferase [Muribaculaceae bacterium]
MNIATILTFESPVGPLLLGEAGGQVCLCDWIKSKNHDAKVKNIAHRLQVSLHKGSNPTLLMATEQLQEYFEGQRTEFDLPVAMCGTNFQKEVWRQLLRVQYGTTDTYAHIAHAIGRPTAVRAVANAIGANPISIIVPCHRIIGSDGSLTGYAGGLKAKQYLLALER